ncbi:MAG: hypothetical protein HDS69_02200 [Bacteroidales bacterium]|nr:hypothetical protein [Bacteroidales bacterium]
MELLPSNRRPDNSGALATTDPRAVAIRQQYGDLPQLCKTFGVTAQRYCAKNVEKAVRNGVPIFASIIKTYGEDGVAGLIGVHITDAILRMGEDREVDEYDVDFIAHAICESERFRLLSMASILRFFHLLKCGEFDIYGKVTPRKILEAFRKYAIEQQAKENRIAYEIEKEKKQREDEEHAKRIAQEGNGWESFKKRNGLDPNLTIAEYYKNMQKEAIAARRAAEEAKKPPLTRFFETWSELIRVLSFVKEYLEIKTKAK